MSYHSSPHSSPLSQILTLHSLASAGEYWLPIRAKGKRDECILKMHLLQKHIFCPVTEKNKKQFNFT